MKYEMIEYSLRQAITGGRYHKGEFLPTEAELSEEYGVSRRTVRHALMLLCESGYIEKRQGSGSRVINTGAPEEERSIAVILTYPKEYIFPILLRDIREVLGRAGYTVKVFQTDNSVCKEREVLRGILDGDFSGVLAEGVKTALPNPNVDLYKELRRKRIPFAFIHGGYPELGKVPCVEDDNYEGAYILTRYLLGKGHTHIGGIFKSDDIQGHRRYLGFVTALIDAGLPVPDEDVLWFSTEDKCAIMEQENAMRLKGYISGRINGLTAVVAYNDEIAYYLMRELRLAGIDVPSRVAVVSFDNSHYCTMCPVPLTSLGHDSSSSGATAAELLLSVMSGGADYAKPLKWTMHVRQSG